MSAPPYMKFFWGDYHRKTRHLTRDQHGAYLLLIGEAWQRGGKLPDDDAMLAAWALCSPDEWAGMRKTILAFFTFRRGAWIHDRVREELAKYESTSRKRKTSGKAGGKASGRARRGEHTENPEAFAEQNESNSRHNQNQNQNQKEEVGGVVGASAPSSDWPEGDLVKALVAEVASPRLDPAKSPGLITSAGRISAWRHAGAPWAEVVVPVVRGLCAGIAGPISSWKFFDAAVARALADSRRGLEVPKPGEVVPFRPAMQSLGERVGAENEEARRRALALLEAREHG